MATPVKKVAAKKAPVKKGKGAFQERDYLAIAKQEIVVARDIPIYPKILIYARKKAGKSTLSLTAAKRHEILVVDPEGGVEYKKRFNPYIWPMNRWEQMNDIYGALRTGKLSPASLELGPEKEPFKWVLIDGLTRLNNFALKYVMRVAVEKSLDRQPDFVDRRDYNKSGELMKTMLTQFHSLKMGVIYTAQEKVKTSGGDWDEEDEDTEATEVFVIPDIPDAVRGSVNSLVDVIGRLYVVRTEDKDGNKRAVRRLRLGVSDRYDTGARSEYTLPDVIKNPTIPKLLTLMQEGSK